MENILKWFAVSIDHVDISSLMTDLLWIHSSGISLGKGGRHDSNDNKPFYIISVNGNSSTLKKY